MKHDARCPEWWKSQQAFMRSSASLPRASQVKRCFVIPHSITSISVLKAQLKDCCCLCICSLFFFSTFDWACHGSSSNNCLCPLATVDVHWHLPTLSLHYWGTSLLICWNILHLFVQSFNLYLKYSWFHSLSLGMACCCLLIWICVSSEEDRLEFHAADVIFIML